MKLGALLGAALLASAAAGCDCGQDHGHDRRRAHEAPAKAADASPGPAAEDDSPPPPAQPAAAPTGRPFGVAQATFAIVEGKATAKIKIAIPESAHVTEGQTLSAAVYFDNGPPIAARLTAHGTSWETATLRLPDVTRTADRLAMRIATTPEATAFVWETTGVWQTAVEGPVTLDTGHPPPAAPEPTKAAPAPTPTKTE